MNIKTLLKSASLVVLNLALSASVLAASVTVTGNGSTFIINKNAGFDGAVGAQREAVFVAAAQVWADILVSPVPIVIDAEFSSLFCTSSSATLGSAGPLSSYLTSGAENYGLENNVWYPTALINSKYGSDFFTGSADIYASFNANIGTTNCLASGGWYYGMDGNTPSGQIDFYEVVLHELGHGLGFLSLVLSNGSFNAGLPDVYSKQLFDMGSNLPWTSLSDSQRGSSILSNGNLVWNGASVNALAGNLSAGVNNGKVQMYAPSGYQQGSSVSHFDTALTPNELMEPEYTGGATHDHSVALFEDIGWTIYSNGNNVPTITGQAALTTNEDTPLTLTLNDLTVSDSDNSFPADFTLTVSSGSNYSVSGSTITPANNFNGTLTVPVRVNDGTDNSSLFNLSVTVTAVNDAPVITGQSTLAVNEDNALTLTPSQLTISDPDDSSFTLTVSGGSNYSVSGTQITPFSNYHGTLTVPVTVNDGEVNSSTFNLTVTVNSVNDAPSITGQTTLAVDEDNSLSLSTSNLSISDPDDSSFTLNISNGSNYTVSGNQITPNSNFNGVLTVPVTVNDGNTNSSPFNLTVTVNPVNDAPTLSGTPVTSVLYNNGYSVSFSATDPENSALTYSLTSGHSWLNISSNGLLSGTPTAAHIGQQSVTVTVSDGQLSDSINYSLTVTDSAVTDVSLTSDLTERLFSVGNSVPLNLRVTNVGSAAMSSGTVALTHSTDSQVTTPDSRCSVANTTTINCSFTNVISSTDFTFNVGRSTAGGNTLIATATTTKTDTDTANNSAAMTLIFANDTSEPIGAINFAQNANTRAAAVADYNRDNVQEVWLANDLTATEQRHEFSASFDAVTLAKEFDVNYDANDVLIVDLNNDNIDDVVFANNGANTVYIANNSGGYSGSSSLGSLNSYAVVAAHFNNDNYLDLMFANQGANELYLNDKTGQFTLAESIGSSTSKDVAVIDYNLDTYPDIVVANEDDDDFVYLNNGADQSVSVFNTSAVPVGLVQAKSHAVAAIDLDHNGVLNGLVIGKTTETGINGLTVYRINSNVITVEADFEAGDITSLSTGDFDGDAKTDIAAVNSDGIVELYTQQSGSLALSKAFGANQATSVLLHQIDGDNEADIVLLRGGLAASQIYLSNQTTVQNQNNQEAQEVVVIIEVTPAPQTNEQAQNDTITVTTSGSFGLFTLLMSLLMLRYRRSAPMNKA